MKKAKWLKIWWSKVKQVRKIRQHIPSNPQYFLAGDQTFVWSFVVKVKYNSTINKLWKFLSDRFIQTVFFRQKMFELIVPWDKFKKHFTFEILLYFWNSSSKTFLFWIFAFEGDFGASSPWHQDRIHPTLLLKNPLSSPVIIRFKKGSFPFVWWDVKDVNASNQLN